MHRSVRPGETATGSRRAVAGLSLLVVLLIGTSVLPWQRVSATNTAAAQVRVARAARADLQATIDLSGDLRPTDQLDLTSRISSRVTRLPATVGRVVQAGEVLAELDRTQQEVALIQAQATLTKERGALAKLEAGPRAAEVARVEAALRAAEVGLEQTRGGAKPEDVDVAAQKLRQARENRAKTASQLSNTKEQARVALEQATASLQAAQSLYGAAKLVYDEAARTGKDPNIPNCPQDNRRCNDLPDTRLRQYKATYEAAQSTLRVAEATVEGRLLAYEDAKQQEMAGLRVADAQVQEAQANLDKLRNGPDPDELAEAEADVAAERANLAKVLDASDLQSARAAVQSAEAAVRLAEANLREAQVTAPFAGIVTQRYVSVGAVVGSSTSIVQLVSQTLEVRASVDDSQVVLLEPGQKASLRVAAYPDATFAARVEAVSPAASQTTRTFSVTLTPEAADARLKPGMLVQAEIAAINRPNVLTIPEQAVITRAVETSVFVVVNDKARRKPVTLGLRGGGLVEVIEGLNEGDTVVVEGQATLNENDTVKVSG